MPENGEFSKYSKLWLSDKKFRRLNAKIRELLPVVAPFSSVRHSQYLDFFQAGLEYEIRLTELDEHEQRITLYEGKLVSSDTISTIRFKTNEILTILSDSPVRIEFSNRFQLEATYICQDPINMTVDLAIEGIFPEDQLKQATIFSSSSMLLKRLSKRIWEWERQEIEKSPNLAPTLFNGTFGETRSSFNISNDYDLNEYQKDALVRSTADGILLIWGPPGTGKTTVLSFSILEALEQNKRVLLASNTNKAIDHALNKIVRRIEEEPNRFPNSSKNLSEDKLLRFREVRTEDVKEQLNEKVSLKSIAKRKSGDILENIHTLKEKLKNAESKLLTINLEISELEKLKYWLEHEIQIANTLSEQSLLLDSNKSQKEELQQIITNIFNELIILEPVVSTLISDEDKYNQAKLRYQDLSKAKTLKELMSSKKEKEQTIDKLLDSKKLLEKILQDEQPYIHVLSDEISTLKSRYNNITECMKLHLEIDKLSRECSEIEKASKQRCINIDKMKTELQDTRNTIDKLLKDKEFLCVSALSKFRNRNSIRNLERAIQNHNGDLPVLESQINEAEQIHLNSQERENSIIGLNQALIRASQHRFEEICGTSYNLTTANKLIDDGILIKQDIDNKETIFSEQKLKITKDEESLFYVNTHIDENNHSLISINTEVDRLKLLLVTAVYQINEYGLPRDISEGMIIVDEHLSKIQHDKSKIERYRYLKLQYRTLSKNLADTEKLIRNCEQQINELTSRLTDIKKSVENAIEKYNVKDPHIIEARINNLKIVANNLRADIDKITSEIKVLDDKLKSVEKSILKDARLVVTTLTLASISMDLLNEEFDCVYIDEMSMCLTPQIYMVVASAKKSVIICGDHAQLPAISKDKNPAKFGIDLFTRLKIGLPESAFCRFLPIQYRFSKEIMRIPNAMNFYPAGYKLKCIKKVDENIHTEIGKSIFLDGKAITIIDTQRSNPEATFVGKMKTILCPYNAFLDLYIAEKLIEEGFRPDDIAIITPYRAQAEFIAAIKQNSKTDMSNLICSTVHKLQGDERKVIIYDIPNSNGSGVKGIQAINRQFISDFPPTEQDRKFNVAITRTRHHFIFVGNISYLERHGRSRNQEYEDSIYRRFLNKLRASGIQYHNIDAAKLIEPDVAEILNQIPMRQSIPNEPPIYSDQDAEVYRRKIIEQEDFDFKLTHILTEKDFYGYFRIDQKEIRERLIIVSPYLSLRRIRWYNEIFIQLIDKNVKIIVYTKPYEEEFSDRHFESIKYLNSIGLTLEYLKGIHSKFIGIDDNICYSGSLNPLSHNCTRETMIRFKGKGCVDAFLQQIRRASSPSRTPPERTRNSLSDNELKKALEGLRGRIAGEKGLLPQFVLSQAKMTRLLNDLPSSIREFMNHPSINHNKLFEGYAEEFVELFKKRRRAT